MPYRIPFKVLTPETVSLLSAEHNRELRTLYIECLALLQGLLVRFSSIHAGAYAFDDPSVVNSLIEERLARIPSLTLVYPSVDSNVLSARQLQAKADILQDSLIETIKANKESALELYADCLTNPEVAAYTVDSYLDILVTQYRALRQPHTVPRTEFARS